MASEVKAQPVIGMWALADPGTFPAPASTHLAFNTLTFGMTRLDATLQANAGFRIGIFDYRGDGRARLPLSWTRLLCRHAVPARARVDGETAITVQGVGFHANTTAAIAAANAPGAGGFGKPGDYHCAGHGGRAADITLERPSHRRVFSMTNALTYGAGPDDTIKLIQGSNPATPVGGQAPNPIQVQVLAPDGTDAGERAPAFFSPPRLLFLSRHAAASGSCTLLTDDSGQASTPGHGARRRP